MFRPRNFCSNNTRCLVVNIELHDKSRKQLYLIKLTLRVDVMLYTCIGALKSSNHIMHVNYIGAQRNTNVFQVFAHKPTWFSKIFSDYYVSPLFTNLDSLKKTGFFFA